MSQRSEGRSFEDGIHPCEYPNCREYVAFDDEPYCFEHSPDGGSHFPGYSYKNETPIPNK